MIDLTLSSEDELSPKHPCAYAPKSQPSGSLVASQFVAALSGTITDVISADDKDGGVPDDGIGDGGYPGGLCGSFADPYVGSRSGGDAGEERSDLGPKPSRRRKKKEHVQEDWDSGGSSSDGEAAAGARKKRGGGRKRLTAEEQQERNRIKAAEKEAKAAERERIRVEKAAIKAVEKERKAAEKDELKRAKAAQKETAKELKEVGNALKVTMVGRYMRVLISNTLAATPLGIKIVETIPLVRNSKKDETFPHEVHKNMPLATRGYKYCMWGVRLPAGAAAKLQAAEGCALEASLLPEPSGKDAPLLLFPALLLVLTGDELLLRLEAEPATPLSGLYNDVIRAHPAASLLVYVVGWAEAIKRRERANRNFNRMAVEDLLFDVSVGMPAVRLQYDCPENDLVRAATDIINLGYTLSQQPRKKLEAYLDTFGSRSTVPLRTIKEVLSKQGGREQLTLCEALSQLVAPQRAAAVAAEYPSMAALIEALNARTKGSARDNMLAQCRIPGVAPAKGKQQVAGPVAAARLARFMLTQSGRDDWKDTED